MMTHLSSSMDVPPGAFDKFPNKFSTDKSIYNANRALYSEQEAKRNKAIREAKIA